MSRSGYSDDCDGWALIRWRGAVQSAIRGARGQAMLRELAQALDALPERRLAADSLVTSDGDYCTLGALGRARGMDMRAIDPEDREAVAKAFGVAEALTAEIMFQNDDEYWLDDPMPALVVVEGPMRPWQRHAQLRWSPDPAAEGNRRWHRMRAWVASHLRTEAA